MQLYADLRVGQKTGLFFDQRPNHAFAARLGRGQAVLDMFAHVGEIVYPVKAGSADTVLEAAIDAGADDCSSDEDGHTIVCGFESLGTVAAALETKLGEAESTKIVWKPNLPTRVDEDAAQTVFKLIAALDDDDDVQNVFSNVDVDEATLAKLTG